MTHRNATIRPAMTAIAAVLAFSTPSFAQTAEPPVTETPAPAPEATAPIVPDAPAPEPAATEATADPLAPAATRRQARRPQGDGHPDNPGPLAPGAGSRRQCRARSAAPAAAPSPAEPAPATAVPVAEAPIAEPLPVEPEAAPVAPAETADASSIDAMLPVAAGGLAVLALAGAGLAMRRRRRRAEEAEEAALRDAQLAVIDDPEPAIGSRAGDRSDRA